MKKFEYFSNNIVAITISLLVGFTGGVVFSVYKIPSLSIQLPSSQPATIVDDEKKQHIQHLEESVAENGENTEAWTQLGHAYFDSDNFKKAIFAYNKVLKLAPNNSAIYSDLGVMYRRNSEPVKAIESFKKAIELDATNIQAQFNVGVVLFHDLNDKDGAIEAWGKVASMQPDYQVSTGQNILQLIENLKVNK